MPSRSSPGSRCVPTRAAAMEFSAGWLVRPDMLLNAASTMSTPAPAAIIRVATPLPLVSWVCRWIGMLISFFSASISFLAAIGFSRPDMSLMPRICVPRRSSSFAIFT